MIFKVYPNHTKTNKVDGLVLASEGPKPIHHEGNVVVAFHHHQKDQQEEEFLIVGCSISSSMSPEKEMNKDS